MEQARRPVSGDVYRHFKDRLYEVVTLAVQSETKEEMVVYRQKEAEGETCVTLLSDFLGEVDHTLYPDASQIYRFELMKEEVKKPDVNQILMAFLDANGAKEKLKILEDCDGVIDDKIINNMAISVDLVIREGAIEDRLDDLIECLRTKARYEYGRLQ